MLNKQGPGKIDWCDWTWNPISGCLHGCEYCYMLRMEKRFPGIMKPAFHKSRLEDVAKLKKPSKIFVGSSGDIWGDWVDHAWINAVFFHIKKYPQHTFQFLTKNPEEYTLFDLDGFNNCWFGTTIDGTSRTKINRVHLICGLPDNLIKFISFEPLIAPVDTVLHGIDWIIIGADSTRGSRQPPKEWADRLIRNARQLNIPVWVKDNYGYPERIKEFPA